MNNTKRYVYLRGYTRQVTVSHKNTKTGEWIVKDGNRTESIPEHCFYHRDPDGMLILRDSSEFIRKYSPHPVEVEKLSRPKTIMQERIAAGEHTLDPEWNAGLTESQFDND